jgi:hypothetical protein
VILKELARLEFFFLVFLFALTEFQSRRPARAPRVFAKTNSSQGRKSLYLSERAARFALCLVVRSAAARPGFPAASDLRASDERPFSAADYLQHSPSHSTIPA